MLTGEYFVLDGAKALAFPTKRGQKMIVKDARGSDLSWKSYDHEGNLWLDSQISLYDFSAVKTTDEDLSKKLQAYLKNAVRLNSEFLNNWKAYKVETHLEFPRDWGLGSSSSLVSLLSEWADVNPFLLHFKVSDGSGYDIACAGADAPIIYTLQDDSLHYEEVDFSPSFKENLFFVHLNEKQSSEDAVKYYFKKVKNRKSIAKEISKITDSILESKSLTEFQDLLCKHEEIVAEAMNMKPVKEERFADYWGCVKSLGAWGGDFVLVTSDKSEKETKAYFAEKGYNTVLGFDEMCV